MDHELHIGRFNKERNLNGKGSIYRQCVKKGCFKDGKLVSGCKYSKKLFHHGTFNENEKLTGYGTVYFDRWQRKIHKQGIFKNGKLVSGTYNDTHFPFNLTGTFDENEKLISGTFKQYDKFLVGNFKDNLLHGEGAIFRDPEQTIVMDIGYFEKSSLYYGFSAQPHSPPRLITFVHCEKFQEICFSCKTLEWFSKLLSLQPELIQCLDSFLIDQLLQNVSSDWWIHVKIFPIFQKGIKRLQYRLNKTYGVLEEITLSIYNYDQNLSKLVCSYLHDTFEPHKTQVQTRRKKRKRY